MHLWGQVQILPPREATPRAAAGGRRTPRQDPGLAGRWRRGAAATECPEQPRISQAALPGAQRTQPPTATAARDPGHPEPEPLEADHQRNPG